MIASPARILRSVLVDLELVSLPGVRVKVGAEPLPHEKVWAFVNSRASDYERAVLLRDEPGVITGRDQPGGKYHRKPGVIVTIRDLDTEAGYANTVALATALAQQVLDNTTVVEFENGDTATHTVHSVTITAGPTHLGEEPGTRRHNWVISTRVSFPDSENFG